MNNDFNQPLVLPKSISYFIGHFNFIDTIAFQQHKGGGSNNGSPPLVAVKTLYPFVVKYDKNGNSRFQRVQWYFL